MNSRSVQSSLRYLIAMVGIIMLSSPVAAKVQCEFGTGIYRNVQKPQHEIAFDNHRSGTLTLKAGQTKLTFQLATFISNGFSRVGIRFAPTLEKLEEGEDITSSVVHLNSNFSPSEGKGEAPYVVIPDLALGLYYSEGFRERDNFGDLLPGDAWKLIGCSSPKTKGRTR